MTTTTADSAVTADRPGDLAVRLTGITKRFPGVIANRDITFAVRRGSVHALVGENGAGKSTLMKILYGVQRADSGTIEVDGNPVTLTKPGDAIGAGIGMVFQHFMLADNLTVLENVVLGAERLHGIGDAARAEVRRISATYGLAVDPDDLVADLGVGARQRVEILKVLYRGARILILDEPTAVLVPQEVTELFGNLRALTAQGLTIIFISHKLDEVLSVADEITVIRQGTTVATVDPKDLTARGLAELMVGSSLPTPATDESTVTDRPVLVVRGLTLAGAGTGDRALLDDVTFTVHAGEVLGIAGVEGNGQNELVEVVMGMLDPTSGTVELATPGTGSGFRASSDHDGDGRDDGSRDELVDISDWHTRAIREAGIGFIPSDRTRHGLLLDAPLWENRVLGHQTQSPNVRGPFIDARGAQEDTRRIVAAYDVRTPSVFVTAASLSGGNQQKLIVGREMAHQPRMLVAAHPTRGVDVGAQAAIWAHLKAARRDGLAVLLVSADLDELIGLSDTIRVILRGRMSGPFDPDTVTARDLGSAMTGADADGGARADAEPDRDSEHRDPGAHP